MRIDVRLFNCDWRELTKTELDAELRCHKALRSIINREYGVLRNASKAKKPSRIREDKLEFFEEYLKILDGEIAEMQERFDSTYSKEFDNERPSRKERTTKRRYARYNESNHSCLKDLEFNRDGINLSWDKEKFMLIARDRGYLTEASVINAVSNELATSRERARIILRTGKFTFGQVLCLGALLEMTPKEFCDTFMMGYFVDYHGQFVASYENLDKTVLLKRATSLATWKELEELDAFAEQNNNSDE